MRKKESMIKKAPGARLCQDMKIIFYSPAKNSESWIDAIAAALPDAEVWLWTPACAQRQADYAIVWAPPAESSTDQAGADGRGNGEAAAASAPSAEDAVNAPASEGEEPDQDRTADRKKRPSWLRVVK